MKKLLFLFFMALFATTTLHAKGFKVTKPGVYTPKAGWSERVSKRTTHAKEFRNSLDTTKTLRVVSLFPTAYVDSLGVLREFSFDEAVDTSFGYTNAIQVGRFRIEYSPTGKMRFLRRKSMIEFIPAFDTTQVGIEFIINYAGIKANYVLDASSPTHLAWKYNHSKTLDKELRGKGKIKDSAGVIRAEIQEMKAWDANHNPVSLDIIYSDDSLLIDVTTLGATFPITVDPSIRDTVDYGTLYAAYKSTNATYNIARNTNTAVLYEGQCPTANILYSSNFNVGRTFMGWDLTGQSTATAIDSVRLWVRLDPIDGLGNSIDTVVFAEATFHGAASVSWFPLFTGHDSSSNAYSVHEYGKAWVRQDIGIGNDTTFSFLFSTTGKADVLSALGTDTLCVVALSQWDVTYKQPADNAQYVDLNFATPWPYLEIYADMVAPTYAGAHPLPGTGTLKISTAKITASVLGAVDSVGVANVDSAAIIVFKAGATSPADTNKIAFAATGIDTFSITTDSLKADTNYVYKVSVHNSTGWNSSSVTDTISTYVSNPSVVTDAYTLTPTGWVHARIAMRITGLGVSTGTWQLAASQQDSVIAYGLKYGLKGDATPDSTQWKWIDNAKYGVKADSLNTLTSDTLVLDTVYYAVAFAKSGTGKITHASTDTTWVSTGGTTPVAISSPVFTFSAITIAFSASLDSVVSGNALATTRGFIVWKKDQSPGDTIIVQENNGSGFPWGIYSMPMSGVVTDTLYAWRAFATNSQGTTYGDIDTVATYLRDLTGAIPVTAVDTVTISVPGVGIFAPPRKPGKFIGKSNR